MTVSNASFVGKSVLVTGASGLTGRNLYDVLKKEGANVEGTCLLRRSPHVDGTPAFYSVDFTDKSQTDRFFYQFNFDYVFICCAQSYNADVCKNNPEALILPNIAMAVNILAACAKYRVSKVMYMSSATVYQPSSLPLDEDELDLCRNPHTLYLSIGWVKRYIEKLCEFYATRGLLTLIVRPTNIYGKYDKTELDHCHVVPAFVMRLLSGENPLVVKTRGDGVKNFIYVDDLVRDMLRIMFQSEESAVYNLTSDEYISIRQVALVCLKEIQQRFNDPHRGVVFSNISDAIPFIGLDRNKLDSTFGRKKYISFETGIKEVITWYSLLPQTQRK